MGSRVQKIAFLIFALMFVAIMAILNTTIPSDDSSLNIYDQGSLYGSSVATCAKDPGKIASTDLTVFVITKADGTGTYYDGTDSHTYDATVADKAINKTAKFKSYLCNNANGVTTGILFIQDGASTDGAAALVNTSAAGDLTIQGADFGG